jgi:hypothetical protein
MTVLGPRPQAQPVNATAKPGVGAVSVKSVAAASSGMPVLAGAPVAVAAALNHITVVEQTQEAIVVVGAGGLPTPGVGVTA